MTRCQVVNSVFTKTVIEMFGDAFEHLKNIRDADLAMHHLRIQGETNEAALGHIAGGESLAGELRKL